MLRWMKVEVRYLRQHQRVFRLLFPPVGRIVCGGDPSQDLVDPTATPTFPLTNQDQPEAPLQEPKEHAEPPSPQMKCVFPSDQREPPLQELKERTGPSNPQMKGGFPCDARDPLRYQIRGRFADDGEGKREREGRSISEKTPGTRTRLVHGST